MNISIALPGTHSLNLQKLMGAGHTQKQPKFGPGKNLYAHKVSGATVVKSRKLRPAQVTPTRNDCRSIIIEAAKNWVSLMPGGLVFRARNVQEHVWGTQILACKERGNTLSGKPRFHADVSAAIRQLEKDNVVQKNGGKWQRK